MTKYLVIYEPADSGGWGAYSPDLPGCVACGDTKTETERLMREAIPMHIEAMREIGEPVPEPLHETGFIAA